MEYVILEIGSRQFKIKKGDIIQADLPVEASKKAVKLDSVLLHHSGKHVEIGDPYIKGATVTLDVLGIGRGPKLIAYKYKKRKSSKFKKGHRQRQVTFKVKDINVE